MAEAPGPPFLNWPVANSKTAKKMTSPARKADSTSMMWDVRAVIGARCSLVSKACGPAGAHDLEKHGGAVIGPQAERRCQNCSTQAREQKQQRARAASSGSHQSHCHPPARPASVIT